MVKNTSLRILPTDPIGLDSGSIKIIMKIVAYQQLRDPQRTMIRKETVTIGNCRW